MHGCAVCILECVGGDTQMEINTEASHPNLGTQGVSIPMYGNFW